MARLNDSAQWIILMGFLVSFAIFFLAVVINQSTVVGQTTAESVLEFPKNDIRNIRAVALETSGIADEGDRLIVVEDITSIAQRRTHAIVSLSFVPADTRMQVTIHYNNGVTEFDEVWISP
jgi:hypothetical protein